MRGICSLAQHGATRPSFHTGCGVLRRRMARTVPRRAPSRGAGSGVKSMAHGSRRPASVDRHVDVAVDKTGSHVDKYVIMTSLHGAGGRAAVAGLSVGGRTSERNRVISAESTHARTHAVQHSSRTAAAAAQSR